MSNYERITENAGDIFIGIDVHRRSWRVTIMMADMELFAGSIPGNWESLEKLLRRYRSKQVSAVYEAGYFGYWLHDRLQQWGADCTVTPPSLLPTEYGNRVKTDKRDSRKLAQLLSKGMLRRVWVPSLEERYHRQVARRRHQLVGDRVRIQNRIKAELRFHGIEIVDCRENWSKAFVRRLRRLTFDDEWMRDSFTRLLDEYQYLCDQLNKQTSLLRKLSQSDMYYEQVKILKSIPGIGVISAMELLLELGDASRFHRANQLAAYVGLTPSQYSSGERVGMGRITRIGKSNLRGILVEAAWKLIGKDKAMREKYERIKMRSGSKRAIVAIARRILLCARRMLLEKERFRMAIAA